MVDARYYSGKALSRLEVRENTYVLEEEWEELHRNASRATPFHTWAWLYSWWEYYGENYELRLVTVRDGKLLVVLLPLMLERRGGFVGRLLFINAGPSTYQDVRIRDGWESQVSSAGSDTLEQMDSRQMADLRNLRPEAAAWSIFREWDRPKAYVQEGNYLIIEVKPWDEMLISLSKRLRGNARRALRQAEADGVRRCEVAGPEDTERAARRLVALHREAWRGRDIDPEYLTERYESFIRNRGSAIEGSLLPSASL
jgi:CelD/BcsL family acetyltransferase involved in cellulose biosynthesis